MTTAEFRAAITALGLTQAELARVLGKGRRTVERWDAGVYPVPVAIAMLLRRMVAERADVSDHHETVNKKKRGRPKKPLVKSATVA